MQIFLPPELEQLIQRQIAKGKYQSALEVITAALHLIKQEDSLYQGRLPELQQDARLGWEAVQQNEVLEGSSAMTRIREELRSHHAASES
ncbi:MAG: type II toxin-antitoxin system ParD family antitoxin [Cyanobacteria bacterium P01_A01_bin.17]